LTSHAAAIEGTDVVAATTRFHEIGVAKNDGYGELRDTAGIACIDMTGMPGMGAMGIHCVKVRSSPTEQSPPSRRRR
jgi:hypothetical protein